MGKTINLVLLSSVVLSSAFVFATEQMGDTLFLNGKKYFTYTYPLQAFLLENLEKLPKSSGEFFSDSGNRRGYLATWEIKEGHLVLTDIATLHAVRRPGLDIKYGSVMSKIFPGQKEVQADSFTGYVILLNGKHVDEVYAADTFLYEQYVILRVEQGVVTRNLAIDTAGFIKFREAQFAAYKKTEDYRLSQAKNAARGTSAEEDERFQHAFYSAEYMAIIFDEP